MTLPKKISLHLFKQVEQRIICLMKESSLMLYQHRCKELIWGIITTLIILNGFFGIIALLIHGTLINFITAMFPFFVVIFFLSVSQYFLNIAPLKNHYLTIHEYNDASYLYLSNLNKNSQFYDPNLDSHEIQLLFSYQLNEVQLDYLKILIQEKKIIDLEQLKHLESLEVENNTSTEKQISEIDKFFEKHHLSSDYKEQMLLGKEINA